MTAPRDLPNLPDHDLGAIAAAAWARLARGAANKRAAFNTMQVATIGAQGWPEMRSVILRAVDAEARQLLFHTDRRSTKAGEIEADGRLSALFWDPGVKLQLRVWGQAQLLTDDPLTESEWTRIGQPTRQIYRLPLSPGRPIAAPADGEGDAESDGRDVFAVVPVTVMRFEWLHLRSGGHRRARFDTGTEGWRGRWLAP
ncbi:MAG: pyridoxamine 5'-phosphate oxidase family protein [Pseudomonadota bacterium]